VSLKIDGKGVIRLGDATSHGGSVVQASGILKVLGIPVARIGDSTVCPLCKGTFPIVEGVQTCRDDGVPIAVNGHKTACGASLITSV
jgi:uncharacterized Zn-binding protein involved in type VI secretion